MIKAIRIPLLPRNTFQTRLILNTTQLPVDGQNDVEGIGELIISISCFLQHRVILQIASRLPEYCNASYHDAGISVMI